jgi:MSHA biogenesis protein MshJ
MNRYWKMFDDWINAREPRERVLLFASAIILPGVLLSSLFVQPAVAERKRLTLDATTDQAEIAKMTLELQSLAKARGTDPDVALRSRLAEMQAKMMEFQKQVDAQAVELVSPEKMAGVLEKILANSPRIQVVEVKVLPRTMVDFEKGAAAAPPEKAQDTKAEPVQDKKPTGIYRHGVEIAIRGNYLDLVAYLKQIESQPVRMLWDKVNLSVGDYPMVTMRVVVYTISMEKAWITV